MNGTLVIEKDRLEGGLLTLISSGRRHERTGQKRQKEEEGKVRRKHGANALSKPGLHFPSPIRRNFLAKSSGAHTHTTHMCEYTWLVVSCPCRAPLFSPNNAFGMLPPYTTMLCTRFQSFFFQPIPLYLHCGCSSRRHQFVKAVRPFLWTQNP